VFKSPLFEEIAWLPARNSPLPFLKLLKTTDFLSSALIKSSDECRSKAQFNPLSLGANNTDPVSDHRAEK